jgi:uncharacterized repeat protein (TIGR01451 family)
MPLINRFSTTDCGAMTFTGNTLGLLKQANTNNAGTNSSSIGAFITLDPTSNVPTYPVIPSGGTTLDWRENESAAILNLPAGSEVLYAELAWSGQFVSQNVGQDLTAFINGSVNFTTPQGNTFSIAPDGATAFEINTVQSRRWYVRSANVTNIVKNAGAGTYSAGSIVGTNAANDNITNFAGWTLAVVYFNPNLAVRNMNLFVGEAFVEVGTTVDTSVSGFTTPSTGPVQARILVSAGEGDTQGAGDQMLFGPDIGSLVNLSGPNNPQNNFFVSQINNDSGNLDTTGTYGNFNGNAIAGTVTFAQRQSWDITNVDGSATLVNGQTSAAVRLTSTGDRYIVNALGTQIDAAPLLEPVKTVNRTTAEIGDTLTYTINIPNNSNADANNVILTDFIPAGTTFLTGSFSVDGAAVPDADPAAGVNIGTIAAFDSVTVTYSVTINDDRNLCGTVISNQAILYFEFGCTGQTDSAESNVVDVNVECVIIEAVKTADTDLAILGNTVTYTITITNDGTVTADNIIFTDILPPNVTLVPNSFTVNDVVIPDANPNEGVNIGTLPPGAAAIVQYTVTLDAIPCPPSLVNQALVSFDFQLEPSQPVQTREINSNRLVLAVAPTSFKQLSVDENVRLPIQKPDIEQILNTLVDVVITDTKVIETIKGTSIEGQILTGFKLIIEGKINQKIEYVADEPTQSVHAAHFVKPFSSFIILPEEYILGTPVGVEAFVEDVFTEQLDKRTVFKNVTFRLLASFSK